MSHNFILRNLAHGEHGKFVHHAFCRLIGFVFLAGKVLPIKANRKGFDNVHVLTPLLLALTLSSIAHAQVAVNPNSYLVFPTPGQAQTRSQQQCQALGCDGTFTKYWWAVVTLTDGTGAIEIQPSGAFSATTTVGACAACGLTANEQSQLQTAAQLGSKLPSSGTTSQTTGSATPTR